MTIVPPKERRKRTRRKPLQDPLVRFTAKVDITLHGCWEWTGARVRGGYGKFFTHKERRADGSLRTVLVPAHRWAYEHWVGPIPVDMEIDHLCRDKGCVNPAHLEAVTRKVNLRRMPRPATCGAGHIYNLENTAYRARRGYVTRYCRECSRVRARAYYHRNKTKAVA